MESKRKKLIMVVPEISVEGGIAAVTGGYRGSRLERDFEITYVESYCDGSKKKKLIKALKAYHSFRRELAKGGCDLVHIHSSFGPSFFRKIPFILMANHRHIPVVNHIHGAEFGPFYQNAPGWKRQLVRYIYSRCTSFIVLSSEWKDRISQIVPDERIHIVPNYSVTFSEEEVKSCQDKRRRNKQILFLGEIGARKGAYDLPQIIARVTARVPEAMFVIAGSGDVDGVRSMIPQDVLNHNVLFPGWVRGDDKKWLLDRSSIFLLPSYNEGMPMSILDAMGAGLAIISTNVGGIPQIVRHGYNGWLYSAGDTKGMAEEIISLLNDPDNMLLAGENSLEIARDSFGLEHHIDLLEEVLEDAAKQRKS